MPIFFILAAMIVGAVVVAQRNVRAGRGDRRGALRLSAFVFAAMFVSWFFGERHVATLWEVALRADGAVVGAVGGGVLLDWRTLRSNRSSVAAGPRCWSPGRASSRASSATRSSAAMC